MMFSYGTVLRPVEDRNSDVSVWHSAKSGGRTETVKFSCDTVLSPVDGQKQ